MSNANLNRAARAKKDEFYTQLSDIERELERDEYRAFFSGKIVYSNCDDYRHSQFVKYFVDNFAALNLKKFIATGLNSGFLIMTADNFETGELEGNGDFRSAECVELLRESDVVVTNPPFSLFREYVAQLVEYKKFFAIIGSINAITYKEIFPLIKENKIWLGWSIHNGCSIFDLPNGARQSFSNVRWFTNIPPRNFDALNLTQIYSPELYPRYDNYDAIEVSKTARIPRDYFGVMGVPITFLDKYNPEQFEIVGKIDTGKIDEYNLGNPVINGKNIYKRLAIRRR